MQRQAYGRRLTAALYHRVSTIDQNPHNAARELRAAAARAGCRVALDVRETGSGARNDRPGLVRVLEAARRGEVDAVIVWKLDRFGRSTLDLLANLRELEAAGVVFRAVADGLELRPGGDPITRVVLTVAAAFAEYARETIRERTRLGLARARRAGRVGGRPRRPRPAVGRVLELRAAGRTWPEVAAELGCAEWIARRAVVEARATERPPLISGARRSPA